MIKFFKKFFEGINLNPKSTSTSSDKGDLEVLDNGRLMYNDGSINDPIVTQISTDTLENKTIDGDDNTVQDLALSSLKTNLTDASKFVQRDASGIVVSNLKEVPTGTVVGTSDTQTLTNKTIDADLNTITNIENADIKSGAAIDAAKLADGSVTNTEFQYINSLTSNAQDQIDSKVAKAGDTMTGTLDMGANIVTSSAVPSGANDLVNKSYVDSLIENLDPKTAARVATTGPGTLATSFENGDTVDGIVLVTGDRLLIKNQVAQEENGIYVVQASGAPVRSADANTWDELVSAQIFVQLGTVNNNTGWFCTIAPGGTLGTDPVTFTQQSGVGTITTDGQGIEITGNQLSLELDGTTLQKSSSGLKVNPDLDLSSLDVDNVNIDGNTITVTSGNLTLDSANGINVSKRTTFAAQIYGAVQNDNATYTNTTVFAPATSILILSGGGSTGINGIDATSLSGPLFLILSNRSGADITVSNDDGTATSVNRILTGTGNDITLSDNASLWLYYDTLDARWKVVGGSGGGSRVVNGNSTFPILISAAGGVTALQGTDEDIYILGNGGGQDVTANPRISAGSVDGQTLRLIGTSNTFYVGLADGNGLVLNGDWTAYEDTVLTLRWDATASVWSEVSRSE